MFCINTESNWLLDKNSIIVYFCKICKFGSNFELPSNVKSGSWRETSWEPQDNSSPNYSFHRNIFMLLVLVLVWANTAFIKHYSHQNTRALIDVIKALVKMGGLFCKRAMIISLTLTWTLSCPCGFNQTTARTTNKCSSLSFLHRASRTARQSHG